MDTKKQALLHYYHGKLIDNTFDEKDVYAFFMLLRNQRKGIRCIDEFAEFSVNRGQYSGYIKEYLFETRKKFESLGNTAKAIRIEDVFPFKDIKNSINKVLVDSRLQALANDNINHLVTCIISILQQINITEDDREVGKLFFALSNKQIILMAEIEVSQNLFKKTNALFPVLTANNRYFDIKKQDRYDTPYLFTDKVIEIINVEGKLGIVIPE